MHDLDQTLRALESEDSFEDGREADELGLDPEVFGESDESEWTGETPPPRPAAAPAPAGGGYGYRRTGRWFRRGRKIVLFGV